jgi:indolepyruvate ferredoxin oxidoreductase
VLLNGTQALVRLMLMQKARDRAAGLNTAGYVTGYRGSPLGAVDMQMRARKACEAADVPFSRAERGSGRHRALGQPAGGAARRGRFDGVFGLWYGKGPGVDRSGDVMRHANMAGTSPHGGVLMAMGDDHTGESSTVLHQSEWAMVDAYMPVLSPAGVQEILDYGLYGFALSRFAGRLGRAQDDEGHGRGDIAVVDGGPTGCVRDAEFDMPEGGLNIRWRSLDRAGGAHDRHKRYAAEAFAAPTGSTGGSGASRGRRSASSRRARTGSTWCTR